MIGGSRGWQRDGQQQPPEISNFFGCEDGIVRRGERDETKKSLGPSSHTCAVVNGYNIVRFVADSTIINWYLPYNTNITSIECIHHTLCVHHT